MLTLTKENCFGRPGPGRILDPIRTTAMCQALFETSQFREESDVDRNASDDRARDAF